MSPTYQTTHLAYEAVLRDVLLTPEYHVAPRESPIQEILDYSFKVWQPSVEPIITKDPARNAVIADYTAKELELYHRGSNSVDDFAMISSFWKKLANPDGTINSGYGKLLWFDRTCGDPRLELYGQSSLLPGREVLYMRTPWEWCVQALSTDLDTRQAVLRFARPDHLWVGNKDQVCTLHAQFFIRNGFLHLTLVMRSNDIILGLVYDLPFFCSLMFKMQSDLLLKGIDVQLGTYTHLAHSMHMYVRDIDKAKKMLGMP